MSSTHSPSVPYYHIVGHTADTAVEVVARNYSELIDTATQALVSILAGSQRWAINTAGEMKIATQDPERVLVQWLNEVLFLLATKDVFVQRASAEPCDNGYLIRYEATTLNLEQVVLETEVKSATYHGLTVQTLADGNLAATIVFDL